jgi:hypothetical protein
MPVGIAGPPTQGLAQFFFGGRPIMADESAPGGSIVQGNGIRREIESRLQIAFRFPALLISNEFRHGRKMLEGLGAFRRHRLGLYRSGEVERVANGFEGVAAKKGIIGREGQLALMNHFGGVQRQRAGRQKSKELQFIESGDLPGVCRHAGFTGCRVAREVFATEPRRAAD